MFTPLGTPSSRYRREHWTTCWMANKTVFMRSNPTNPGMSIKRILPAFSTSPSIVVASNVSVPASGPDDTRSALLGSSVVLIIVLLPIPLLPVNPTRGPLSLVAGVGMVRKMHFSKAFSSSLWTSTGGWRIWTVTVPRFLLAIVVSGCRTVQ